MICPECNNDMEDPSDTTVSNMNSKRVKKGEQTGDIYKCNVCERFWLDNFLSGEIEPWNY